LKIEIIDNDAAIYIQGKSRFGDFDIESVKDTKEEILHYVDRGYEILIDGVSADEYFFEDDDKNVDENVNNDEINYEDVFVNVGHWTEKAENVKQYDDIEKVEKLLEYAEENESDGVVKRIKKYLEELR